MRVLLAAIVGLCLASAASGQTLQVAPVSIALAPEQRTASLSVTNRGTTSVVIQVRPFVWRETNGTATLSDTAALAVSPPLAEIAAGQTQSIRLLLREPPGATEATYRLLVDQIPPPNATGLRVAIRLSLPVFAMPSVRAAAELEWRVLRSRDGDMLSVQNRGNRHATITGIKMAGPSGAAVPVRTSTHPYVLAGAAVQWPIDARVPNGPIRLTVTSDTGVLEATASAVNAPP